jgi:two-component system, chemotaxis family, protein-glutamate methylesterase/glutaminase
MIRTLVVDDSFFMRKLISDMLNSDPSIEVIGTAKEGIEAIKKVKKEKPDVVTLDVLMPGLDGLATLKRIMAESPTPVIMLSAFTKKGADITLDCLHAGAVSFILKPSGELSLDIDKIREMLLEEIKTSAYANVKKIKALPEKKPIQHLNKPCKEKIVVIGASTGGPRSLELLMSSIPASFSFPILIVQHMPAMFTQSLAQHLNKNCVFPVKEAKAGDVIQEKNAYVAPGDFHLTIKTKKTMGKTKQIISLNKNPPVNGSRPSIDVTMQSVANTYGENTIGVILTGMGKDGVIGMKAIKEHGGKTIAQDEESCLIFGMPKVVIENGYADNVLSLSDISEGIVGCL